MGEITLREICASTGISRRAIQGYEANGLVSATNKNDRGHLLYDDSSQEKIKRIKLFQEMGFTIKEIKELEMADKAMLKEALEERIVRLKAENGRIREMIAVAQKMIDSL